MSKDLTTALDALTREAAGLTSRVDRSLPAAKVAPAIPARAGTGKPAATSGGGAIASPLTEPSYAARLWHPATTIYSSDGLFSATRTPLKQITMTDANGATVVLNFAAPP